MAFLCPARRKRSKIKITGPRPLEAPVGGRITGSDSIDTLVRVGLEKEAGIPRAKMVVLHDFHPCVDDELAVKRGQEVFVLYQENDWLYVIAGDQSEGFVPYTYCLPVHRSVDDFTNNTGKEDISQNNPQKANGDKIDAAGNNNQSSSHPMPNQSSNLLMLQPRKKQPSQLPSKPNIPLSQRNYENIPPKQVYIDLTQRRLQQEQEAATKLKNDNKKSKKQLKKEQKQQLDQQELFRPRNSGDLKPAYQFAPVIKGDKPLVRKSSKSLPDVSDLSASAPARYPVSKQESATSANHTTTHSASPKDQLSQSQPFRKNPYDYRSSNKDFTSDSEEDDDSDDKTFGMTLRRSRHHHSRSRSNAPKRPKSANYDHDVQQLNRNSAGNNRGYSRSHSQPASPSRAPLYQYGKRQGNPPLSNQSMSTPGTPLTSQKPYLRSSGRFSDSETTSYRHGNDKRNLSSSLSKHKAQQLLINQLNNSNYLNYGNAHNASNNSTTTFGRGRTMSASNGSFSGDSGIGIGAGGVPRSSSIDGSYGLSANYHNTGPYSSQSSFNNSPSSASAASGTGVHPLTAAGVSANQVQSFTKQSQGEFLVMYSFTAQQENDIAVEKGEIVTVLNSDDADWFWIQKRNNLEGFIPSNYVIAINNKDELPQNASRNMVPSTLTKASNTQWTNSNTANKNTVQHLPQVSNHFSNYNSQDNTTTNYNAIGIANTSLLQPYSTSYNYNGAKDINRDQSFLLRNENSKSGRVHSSDITNVQPKHPGYMKGSAYDALFNTTSRQASKHNGNLKTSLQTNPANSVNQPSTNIISTHPKISNSYFNSDRKNNYAAGNQTDHSKGTASNSSSKHIDYSSHQKSNNAPTAQPYVNHDFSRNQIQQDNNLYNDKHKYENMYFGGNNKQKQVTNKDNGKFTNQITATKSSNVRSDINNSLLQQPASNHSKNYSNSTLHQTAQSQLLLQPVNQSQMIFAKPNPLQQSLNQSQSGVEDENAKGSRENNSTNIAEMYSKYNHQNNSNFSAGYNIINKRETVGSNSKSGTQIETANQLQHMQQQNKERQKQQQQHNRPPELLAENMGLQRILCLYNYEAQAPDDVTIARGDYVYGNLSQADPDWLWVYHPGLHQSGYVPRSYTKTPAVY